MNEGVVHESTNPLPETNQKKENFLVLYWGLFRHNPGFYFLF
jgi:hypothetical protein